MFRYEDIVFTFYRSRMIEILFFHTISQCSALLLKNTKNIFSCPLSLLISSSSEKKCSSYLLSEGKKNYKQPRETVYQFCATMAMEHTIQIKHLVAQPAALASQHELWCPHLRFVGLGCFTPLTLCHLPNFVGSTFWFGFAFFWTSDDWAL